jgi:hypothetical protein
MDRNEDLWDVTEDVAPQKMGMVYQSGFIEKKKQASLRKKSTALTR